MVDLYMQPTFQSINIALFTALIYALMLDLIISVETPLPDYSLTESDIFTRTSPKASLPPATALLP